MTTSNSKNDNNDFYSLHLSSIGCCHEKRVKSNIPLKFDKSELIDFIKFKKRQPTFKSEINFSEKVTISKRFKCINWFEYNHNQYLSFIVLKAKSVENDKVFYIKFRKYNYVLFTEKAMKKHSILQFYYNESKNPNSNYNIISIDITNKEILQVSHFYNYNDFKSFRQALDTINKNINKTEKTNFIILGSNFSFTKEKKLSDCENMYLDYGYFYVLNSIIPSGSYEIKNMMCYKNPITKIEMYYMDDFDEMNNIKNFFKNPIVLSQDVKRNYFSFDLESEVVPHRDIESCENILTHSGIEYFNTKQYDDFKKYGTSVYDKLTHENNPGKDQTTLDDASFNICLVNIDFHIRNNLLNSPEILNQMFISQRKRLSEENFKDFLYHQIKNRKHEKEFSLSKDERMLLQFVAGEIIHLRSRKDTVLIDSVIMDNIVDLTNSLETNIKMKQVMCQILKLKKKYIFVKELDIIRFMISMWGILEIDYILTYNGHNYDFPQLGRKLTYLTHKTISKSFHIPALHGTTKIKYNKTENNNTNFSMTSVIIEECPYFSIDIFTYVLKFQNSFNSYSLKEVAKQYYNIKVLYKRTYVPFSEPNTVYLSIRPINQNKENLRRFFYVLLTSNYCFINNFSYKIHDKSSIITKDESIYDIDIDKIISSVESFSGHEFLTCEIIIKRSLKTFDSTLNIDNTFKMQNYDQYIVNLKLSKDDVEISAADIYEHQSTFDVADYCIHDTMLCRYLCKELLIKENIDPLSTHYILPQWKSLVYRNMTNIKGFLLQESMEVGFLIKSKKIQTGSFTGGLVIDPKETFLVEPLMLLDFESLYPSIMINYNISPDCLKLIVDSTCPIEYTILKKEIAKRYPVEHYTIVNHVMEHQQSYVTMVFTKIYEDGSPRIGILNHILNKFKVQRKLYKAAMKKYDAEGNHYQRQNMDLLQNTIKILMNSMYGMLGSKFSEIACKYSSQAITNIGARSLRFLLDYLNNATIQNNQLSIHYNRELNKKGLEVTRIIDYNPIAEHKFLTNYTKYDFPYNDSHQITLNIIYGDTDSIMIIPTNINMHPCIVNCEDEEYQKKVHVLTSYIGTHVTNFINNIITQGKLNIEFEAIYYNTIILSKKKYKTNKIEPMSSFPSDFDTTKLTSSMSPILNFKSENKGISLKRRDNCNFQKTSMLLFFNSIHEIINSHRYKKSQFSESIISKNIWEFLSKRIALLVNMYYKKTLNISDFLISCAYTEEYKDKNNPTQILVTEYNKTARDKIVKGDRFNFIYTIPANNKHIMKSYNILLEKLQKEQLTKPKILNTEQTNSANPNNEQTVALSNACKLMNWRFIGKEINNFKEIYDENSDILDYNNGQRRLFFEIYINKLKTDIITIFKNDQVKKDLQTSQNEFQSKLEAII